MVLGFCYVSMWGEGGQRVFSLSLLVWLCLFLSLSVIFDWSSPVFTCSPFSSLPLFNASFFLCLHSCQWIMIELYLSKILAFFPINVCETSYSMYFLINSYTPYIWCLLSNNACIFVYWICSYVFYELCCHRALQFVLFIGAIIFCRYCNAVNSKRTSCTVLNCHIVSL